MNKLSLLFVALFCAIGTLSAQTLEELKEMKAEKQAAYEALQAPADAAKAEVDAIASQIANLPGWRFGGMGVVGLDFSGNDSWYAIGNPFATSRAYGLSAGLSANLKQDKYFWNNFLNFNFQQSFTKPDEDADEVEAITDALDLSSLFGYNLSSKWAVSAEGRYQSTALQFNDPGKLIASAGVTWLPIENLVVIIHPLGYEKNWPGELVSSTGAKVGATYATNILKNVAWTSNLTAFVPYQGGDATYVAPDDAEVVLTYEAMDMLNWTWINGFSTTIWKGIGVGLNIGLRQDRQLADKFQVEADGTESDNPLQMYYNLGLSYTL
jgi:hypothetical protein